MAAGMHATRCPTQIIETSQQQFPVRRRTSLVSLCSGTENLSLERWRSIPTPSSTAMFLSGVTLYTAIFYELDPHTSGSAHLVRNVEIRAVQPRGAILQTCCLLQMRVAEMMGACGTRV